MSSVIEEINNSLKKKAVVSVRSGDNVRVHQRVKEGSKERVQVFQGLVIKTSQKNGPLYRITVRRIASGIGVEKSFLMHSPQVVKVEVTKRSKVRRNYLSYMRNRTGKSARLAGVGFDRMAVNNLPQDEETTEASNKDLDNEALNPKTEETQIETKEEEKKESDQSEKSTTQEAA